METDKGDVKINQVGADGSRKLNNMSSNVYGSGAKDFVKKQKAEERKEMEKDADF